MRVFFLRRMLVILTAACLRVSHFAELYAKKLGIQADTLRKTLWGDFFLNTKTKRIHKGAQVGMLPQVFSS